MLKCEHLLSLDGPCELNSNIMGIHHMYLPAKSKPVSTGEIYCSTVPERAGEKNMAHVKGEKERTRSLFMKEVCSF